MNLWQKISNNIIGDLFMAKSAAIQTRQNQTDKYDVSIATSEKDNQQNMAEVKTMDPNKKKKDEIEISKELLEKFYYDMLMIRRFEEKAGQLYGMGLIGGFCHLYIGQEAVVTGFKAAMKEGDSVITTYRDHGHILSCGVDPKIVMAELTGRAGGISKGKGGSMHMFDTEQHFYGGHGIVGASVPLGAGLAFAHKYNDTDNINLCYFGDGAANQGQVYESFNMASLWGLPIIFIIENNEYGMGTSVARSSSTTDLYRRGESFGIEGRQVDGMDVTAVYEAAVEAVNYVRTEQKPLVMELKTYRYRGHSMSDPAKYRSKEEVTDYKQNRDPIDSVKDLLLAQGSSEEELKTIDKEIKAIVAEAADFAKESPEPDVSELYTDVVAQ